MMGLATLETQILSDDLIEVLKVFKGLDNIRYKDFFTLSSTGLKRSLV